MNSGSVLQLSRTYHSAKEDIMTRLIGKRVTITNPESIYYGEWGTILDFDGEYHYIAIADGDGSVPIFTRDEFRVPRR